MPKLPGITIALALILIASADARRIPAELLQRLAYLGTPKIDTYDTQDTGITGETQNITQLPGGEIAVMTDRGIFSFDGTHWTTLDTERINWPLSAITLSEESLAIGFDKGIAKLRSDGIGGYEQRSIIDLSNVDRVSAVAKMALAKGHMFATKDHNLIVIDPNERIGIHPLPNWPQDLVAIGDQIFTFGGIKGSPLNRWDWEKQELVEANDLLKGASPRWLTEATSRSEGGVWIRTIDHTVIGFDGSRSWNWPGNDTLAERSTQITCLVETQPGELAIGTKSQGVLIFDRSGNLIRQVAREDGLNASNVKRIVVDGQNGLWIATRQSVARLDLDFETLLFDEQHGIDDAVNAVEIFDGKIYLGTKIGLYASASNPRNKSETFHLVNDTPNIADLCAYEDHLFVAGSAALSMDRQGNFKTLNQSWGTNIFHPSRYPDLVLACSPQGVQRIEKRDGEWFPGPMLSGDKLQVFSIAEAKDGELWGSLGPEGIGRIYISDTAGSIEKVPISVSQPQDWSYLLKIEDEIYLNTVPMARLDVSRQEFVVDDQMKELPGDKPYGFKQVVGRTPDQAFVTANVRRSMAYPRPNHKVLGAISNIGTTIDTLADCIAYDDDGNAWIGGGVGLLLARSPRTADSTSHPKPRLHRLTSVKDHANLPVDFDGGSPLVLRPRQDSLVIQVEFPEFAATRTVQYRINLEGLDTAITDFSHASMREITNLAPGDYRLQITAKCIDGTTSETLEIPITLLAHWYERAWAFGLYAATLIIVVFAIVKWNTRRVERESLELEKTIAKRTEEIQSKNQKLEQQAETLERRNVELAEKSDELQQTTDSLTETLHTLQKTQDQLLATARTAGKAEIATNVLHNVGNVLNSVNVNLSSLSTKTGNSSVSKLSKLAQLIESQQHDIETFFTKDERGKLVPEYIKHMSTVLEDEIRVMDTLIDTMESDVSHIKNIVAAQQTYAKSVGVIQEFNLSELCDAAIAIADTKGNTHALEIVNDLPAKLVLQNDKERVLEIILNLISNAKHAIRDQNPERGLIAISAENVDDGKRIAITITDNGVGFDKALKSQLFNHGFTTKKDGHGFGLHSCANAASALGGQLSLDSPGRGKGATATLTLPLANT